MRYKFLLLLPIILTLLFLFIFTYNPLVIKISFIINGFLLLIFTLYHLFIEKNFSPILSCYIIFNLLFFIIAPTIQIHTIFQKDNSSFIQNLPFDYFQVIQANITIFLFNLVFFIFYITFKVKKYEVKKYAYHNIPLFLIFWLFLCILIILTNKDIIINNLLKVNYLDNENTSKSTFLLIKKFLFYLPIAGVILAYDYIKNYKNSNNLFIVKLLLPIFFLIVILLINPLSDKRNAIGPLYITLIFIFFRRLLNTNMKVFLFMFYSMIIVFPTITILTHSPFSISQMIQKPKLISTVIKYQKLDNTFNTLHYDAYINYLATIDFVKNKDITYGKQLSAGIFFYVPRKIWTSKPETTGIRIGNYLIKKYKFTFNNLSNPYISEGYINFGYLGIFLYAIILAYFFNIIVRWIKSEDILKKIFAFYFSIYIFLFLRGDFTNGFAYGISAFFAILLFPKFLNRLFKFK